MRTRRWWTARGTGLPASSEVSEGCPGYLFNVGDGISYLQKLRCGPEWLIYCDPPYLRETRSSRRRLYRCELESADHVRFLDACRRLPARVMVSGYHCELYDLALSSWRVVEYSAMTRGGKRTEVLWCNFREPTELHDYRYYGRDYRERERVGRKRARWLRRLSGNAGARAPADRIGASGGARSRGESPGGPRLNDLGCRRDNYRGDAVGCRAGPVPAGSGGIWRPSRVPESVRASAIPCSCRVRIGASAAAKQETACPSSECYW